MAGLIKWFAVWKNKKGDKEWLAGKCGDAVVQIWPNGFKKTDKHPDYIVYITEPPKRDAAPESHVPAPNGGQGDDMPF